MPGRAGLLPVLGALLLLAPTRAEVPASPKGNVSDYAGALSSDHRERLDALGPRLEDAGVKLAVVVLGSAQPLTPKMWAVKAFNTWGVGDAGKDNGLLVLLATEDRRVEVEVGYGLEGRLTDSQVGRLLDRHAVPHFRQNAWGEGLVSLCEGIAAHFGVGGVATTTSRPAAAPRTRRPARREPARGPRRTSGAEGFLLVLMGAALFLLNPAHGAFTLAVIWILWCWSLPLRRIFVNRRFWLMSAGVLAVQLLFLQVTGEENQVFLAWFLMFLFGLPAVLYTLGCRCPRCRVGWVESTSRTLRAATYTRSGRGETTRDCDRCPFHVVDKYSIPKRVRTTSSSSSSSWSSSSSSWSSSSSYSSSSWSSSSSSFGGGFSGGGGAGRSF